jgi:hypothetical protein
VYTARFPCCPSDAGTLTETDAGNDVVVVGAPVVVSQTITGSDAVTIGPEPLPPVPTVEDVVELAAVVVEFGGNVLDVVDRFGWVVPDDEPVPEDPHAVRPKAPATNRPPTT